MWKCENCGEIFNEPEFIKYCLEDYNGVSSLFPDRHYATYPTCPDCGSKRLDEYYEDEEDLEVIYFCDIYKCEDCPVYGDSCDGKED